MSFFLKLWGNSTNVWHYLWVIEIFFHMNLIISRKQTNLLLLYLNSCSNTVNNFTYQNLEQIGFTKSRTTQIYLQTLDSDLYLIINMNKNWIQQNTSAQSLDITLRLRKIQKLQFHCQGSHLLEILWQNSWSPYIMPKPDNKE